MLQSVRIFPSADNLYRALAGMIIRDLDRLEPDQYYSIALSGGTTPRQLFKLLSEEYADTIMWEKVLIFWGDERCVPADSNESNYNMTYDTLLQNILIPDTNIFRIRGEANPASEAAQYSSLVKDNLPEVNGIPQFDLMLLGVGEDGHTASIFPDQIGLFGSHHLFETAVKPDSGQKRITATGKLINNSAKVIFLVTGTGKANIVSEIVERKTGYEKYPASKINPGPGRLLWFLDKDAASGLNKP